MDSTENKISSKSTMIEMYIFLLTFTDRPLLVFIFCMELLKLEIRIMK